MKLADPRVLITKNSLFQIWNERFIPYPRTDLAARAIWAQLRDHQVGRRLVEALLAVVARAGDQRALEAGLAHDGDRLLHRHGFPRVVAVVQVRVEDRQLLSLC